MRINSSNQFVFSPTDLANHISCHHITYLNKQYAQKLISRPKQENRLLDLLRQKGLEFEENYLSSLKSKGLSVLEIMQDDANAAEKTIQAMHDGVDVIYQARLVEEGIWEGWSDFLIKIPGSSQLGAWEYEVVDTKLASKTRAGTILQIALYSERIGAIQGKMPEKMYVQKPEGPIDFRVDDYIAYVRLIKKKLATALTTDFTSYPEPIEHCEICSWFTLCNKQRRADDHLGFVAGMGNSQIKEVRKQDIFTLKQLAEAPLPLAFKPSRGNIETFSKLREQARLQLSERENDTPIFEMLPLIPGRGLFHLPERSKHDIYLDLEGDRLVEPDGREYLFGWIYQDSYTAIWAETAESELSAFEEFMDFASRVKSEHPDMHIYHYNHYEVTAFKRLMGKYATKAAELDIFLRSQTFVDLYPVVKQSLQASVEKYSIKDLEKFYGYTREMNLRDLSQIKIDYEFLLETNDLDAIDPMMREAVQLYNQDDCFSTYHLHVWLESLRADMVDKGFDISRPEILTGDANDQITEHQQMIKPIFDALLDGVPLENQTLEENAKFILAHMLDWYPREDKSFWWEFYELKKASEDELFENRKAISYLKYTGERIPEKRSFVDTYSFPKQETDIKSKNIVKISTGQIVGEVIEVNHKLQLIKIKKTGKALDIHPDAVFVADYIDPKDKLASIVSLAESVVANGIDSPGSIGKCGRDLLLRKNPDMVEAVVEHAGIAKLTDWALKLNNSTLAIQGPPGTGKSYTCSHVVINLIKAGKKIGITALSHKVIENLLGKIYEVAEKEKMKISIVQRAGRELNEGVSWICTTDNDEVFSSIGRVDILAGTSFFWSKPELINSVDYLIIDEAGQLSLIDTLAISRAGKNLLLLGDPQQLQQPVQGTHPDGTAASALEHLLNGNKTIASDQGMFLEKTWRMHPAICAYDSEMFYENKLTSMAELAHIRVNGNELYDGTGLRVKLVKHEGDINASEEEARVIAQMVEDLCQNGMTWTNEHGITKQITRADIKIISPYNAQVQTLMELIADVQIGTVDKFQGQEAPIVIYSVATSSPQDAPRGMEFLYSPNRINVAVSRAKALFILVATDKIFEPDCKNPAQIKLANPLCRYRELAIEI